MKRQQPQPKTASATDRLVAILDRELLRAHARVDFLTGKCERLELAMAAFSNAPAKAYVDRTDAKPPIEEVAAEPQPQKWKQVKQNWAAMTDEQKQAIIDGKGAN